MNRAGMGPLLDELNAIQAGICPACGCDLPLKRTRQFTCGEACHQAWVETIVARHGETREVTHAETRKVYLVPTRVILERGIKGTDLPAFPEKMKDR